MDIKKNDIIDIEITGLTHEGFGVGRYDGTVIFVAAAAPGDVLTARILKPEKRYAWAKIEKLIHPAECRQEYTGCAGYSKCGGCSLRHVNYDTEIQAKCRRVHDAFKKFAFSPDECRDFGGSDAYIEGLIDEVISAEKIEHYRNKAIYPVSRSKIDGSAQIGFYSPRTHNIVDTDECPIQSTAANDIVRIFREYLNNNRKMSVYDETAHKGILRAIYIRSGDGSGEVMVTVVANLSSKEAAFVQRRVAQAANRLVQTAAGDDKAAFADGIADIIEILKERICGMRSVCLNLNTERDNVMLGRRLEVLWGDGYITDTLCGQTFRLSPLAFYQVNRSQTEKLYRKAAEYAALQDGQTLMDLYCGIGTIGICMAAGSGLKNVRLVGVEIVPEAVANAEENAKLCGIDGAEYICGTAEEAAVKLLKRGIRPDVIVVDPPRKGCDAQLLTAIAEMKPDKIVYISCKAETLARDVKLLTASGYRMQKYSVVDLFPRTGHVETVVLMSRIQK